MRVDLRRRWRHRQFSRRGTARGRAGSGDVAVAAGGVRRPGGGTGPDPTTPGDDSVRARRRGPRPGRLSAPGRRETVARAWETSPVLLADVDPVPAHPARGPGRRRGAEPPPAGARRATSAGPRPASSPGCRWAAGCCATSSASSARRWTRWARRRCTSRRCCPREPYEATGRWTEYGDNIFRLQGPQGRRLPARPDARGDVHAPGEGPVLVVQGPAAVALPDPDQVPRRGAAPGRAAARPRVRDEGLATPSTSTTPAWTRSYAAHRDAYIRIFDRLGLDYVIVSAMSGRDGRLGERGVPAPDRDRRGHLRPLRAGGYAANVEAVAHRRAADADPVRRTCPRRTSRTPRTPRPSRRSSTVANAAVPARRPATGRPPTR